jgi:dienelactone hydrolase
MRRRRRRLTLLIILVLLFAIGFYVVTPYERAASLIVRAADLGGRAEALAKLQAYHVERRPRHMVPTRHGDVPAQLYLPAGGSMRAVLLIPGIHSMGIEEPRLTALAEDLAATGFKVMAMALPDLQRYRITLNAPDVIEDAVAWLSARRDLAPDGRVGIAGISFAGGMSVSAAGRPGIRDKLAFVFSFGGHADLPRVLRYLATGTATKMAGIDIPPPHDYGVAVELYQFADRGVVPPEQVEALRQGVETFLLASQLTLVSMDQANATFAKAREMANALPEPSRTYMNYVNDRAVTKLGPVLLPFLNQAGVDDPALSPQRAPQAPAAPVYLLHGDGDTVIPTSESVVLGDHLRQKGADVHVLLSGLITHAEVNRSAAAAETWKLIRFWADVLRQ